VSGVQGTVLLVDDDAKTAHSLAAVLAPAGCNVQVALSSRGALERLEATPRPDLVILLHEAAPGVRETAGQKGVPVIEVRKPVRPDDVRALVQKHLQPRVPRPPLRGADLTPSRDAATRLLRYRFDHQVQLQNHLHVVDTRGLFFYRDPKLRLPPGSRVVIEVAMGDINQQCILRGHVLGQHEERAEGVWIEFGDARLARRAAEGPISQRRHRRLPTDLLIELRGRTKPQVCRMLDLSISGARLGGLAEGVSANVDVELRLLAAGAGLPDPAVCVGAVSRVAPGEAGIRFARNHSATRQIVASLLGTVEQAWAGVRDVSHPGICCAANGVLDPPLPHLARRT
jgi:CheY-like chemotaxis protein